MGDIVQTWWQAVSDWAAGGALTWVDLLVSSTILLAAIAIAILFSTLIFRWLLRRSIMAGVNFDVKTVAAVRIPFAAFIILAGLYLGITYLSPPPAVQILADKAGAVIAIMIGAVLINGVASAALHWLQIRLHRSDPHHASGWLFPMMRRGLLAFIIATAAMVALDILGINISPLVAGLGIAGLAVALALQPTLGNLFAGAYVTTEGLIEIGDYIEMSDGTSGFVMDVSWRSARLRTRTNNLVVIPNSLFAETIITNFNKPDAPVNMIVPCGVAYESDLEVVERTSLEVANTLRQEIEEAEPEFEPRFFYQAFGDSNIDFVVVVQAKNRLAGFIVRSELIKRLHSRFATEGITINYPVRTLNFPEGFTAQNVAQLPGGAGDEAQ